jgi:hypothetical protein
VAVTHPTDRLAISIFYLTRNPKLIGAIWRNLLAASAIFRRPPAPLRKKNPLKTAKNRLRRIF